MRGDCRRARAHEQIDRLRIDGGDQGKVELRKVNGTWWLPGHFDAPADARKVDGMLNTLLDMQRSWSAASGRPTFCFPAGEGFSNPADIKK